MRQNTIKAIGDTETSQEFNQGIGQELNSVVEGAGLSFDNNSDKQLLQSMSIITSNRMSYKEVAGSTGEAYVIQTYQDNIEPLISVVNGAKISIYITNTNSTTTPTLKFDNLPTLYTIKKSDGSALTEELLQANTILSLFFDGTNFVLENELTTERNINQLNVYTSVFSSNTYNLQNIIKNPTEYYNGLVVVFLATSTCTPTPKININLLGDKNIVDIQKETITASEILLNDVVECIYYGNEFHVIKKSSKIKNVDNVLCFQNDLGSYIDSLNINPNLRITADTTLTKINVNQMISINNATSKIITLPLLSSISSNSKFVFQLESNSYVTFNTGTGNSFIIDNTTKTTFESNIQDNYIVISYITSFLYSVSYTANSSETLYGSIKTSTQALVDGLTDDTTAVTPKTLANTPFIANLNIIYPIGSTKEFYSATDPNPNTLTGYSAFTWVRVANGLVSITDTTVKIGTTTGSQESVGGNVNGTTLTIAQIPEHNHELYYNEAGSSGGTNPVGFGVVSTPFTKETGTRGGGQAHTHVLDLKTTYYSKWVRTA
jgi:hypothetical protein